MNFCPGFVVVKGHRRKKEEWNLGLIISGRFFLTCSSFYHKILWKLKTLLMDMLWRQKRLLSLLYLLEATCVVARKRSYGSTVLCWEDCSGSLTLLLLVRGLLKNGSTHGFGLADLNSVMKWISVSITTGLQIELSHFNARNQKGIATCCTSGIPQATSNLILKVFFFFFFFSWTRKFTVYKPIFADCSLLW